MMIVRMVDDVAVQGEVEVECREGRGLSDASTLASTPIARATSQVKTGQVKAGQVKTGQVKTGQVKTSQMGTNALARELTDIIHLLSARGSRAPVPSWLVGRLVTYRDHLAQTTSGDEDPS